MQKLITLILILGLFSCSDNIDQFVPSDISVVQSELKNVGQPKSSSFKLNNNALSHISTDKDIDIEIPMNTFYDPSELTDIPYQLDIIELNSYSDYITSNITQVSNERIRDVIFSIYVSAKDNDDNNLSIKNDNEITIRVPSSRRLGSLQLGSAYVSNNSIAWSYTNPIQNAKIKYTEWSRINNDNILEEFSGYEFSVPETGWYSLTLINDDPYTLNDICLSIDDEKLNADNTLVYIVLDSHQYLIQAQSITSNNFCSYNVPVASNSINIIAISYLEDEDQFYYDSMLINPNEIESSINLNPELINIETLASTLENL